MFYFTVLSFFLLLLIFGLPAAVLGAMLDCSWHSLWRWPALVFSPLAYAVSFALTAGLLSLPFQSGIVAGKFPRNVRHPVYRKRRLYGLCWTAVYYFKPVYYLCLSIPWLKWLLFRLFGYRGSMKFTVYPDTWIRDLPLLSLEDGVYVANRATLGTNIALSDGRILVDHIRLGKNALVGHLAMLAPGVELDEGAEIAVGCAVGVRCKVGKNSLIQPVAAISHRATFGDKVTIGTRSFIGLGTRVESGISVPPGSAVPGRKKINTQADVKEFGPALRKPA